MGTAMRDADYHVDIQGVTPPERRIVGGDRPSLRGRPWLAVKWDCCSVYSRVYRNAEATAYVGRCPRCGKQVSVKVGPGGTSDRFFTAR